jgi:hypothetical protein
MIWEGATDMQRNKPFNDYAMCCRRRGDHPSYGQKRGTGLVRADILIKENDDLFEENYYNASPPVCFPAKKKNSLDNFMHDF